LLNNWSRVGFQFQWSQCLGTTFPWLLRSAIFALKENSCLIPWTHEHLNTFLVSEIVEKIKTILWRIESIHFCCFSKILLLFRHFPSAPAAYFEQPSFVLSIINNLHSGNIKEATDCFEQFWNFAQRTRQRDQKEVFNCLLIPCCFLIGAINKEESLHKKIKKRLFHVPKQPMKSVWIGPCTRYIVMACVFSQIMMEICRNPLGCIWDDVKYCKQVQNSPSLLPEEKHFLERYLCKLCEAYCRRHNMFIKAAVYKSRYTELMQ